MGRILMPGTAARTAALLLLAAAAFFLPSSRPAHAVTGDHLPPVQIYAPLLDKVVRVLPNTEEIRSSAASWLAAADGLSPGLRIREESRLVLRIPLHPPLAVSKARLSFHCRELFLLVPLPGAKENPQLLAFGTGDGTYVFDCAWSKLQPFWERYGLADLPYQ
ncbi:MULTISPECIES: hypothetical protein [Paenibacillus]|uniref:hypothetical protein n=1 Tax=Paenibacillus TaxID=44249 RepID=UPI0022B858B9|nr:hypothetical protein [Paenibacillus caseinilyticus]MCZ8522857.1 hypothetical protein [Paenibacillus caseinilyticus]